MKQPAKSYLFWAVTLLWLEGIVHVTAFGRPGASVLFLVGFTLGAAGLMALLCSFGKHGGTPRMWLFWVLYALFGVQLIYHDIFDGFLSLSARIRWRFDRKTLRSLWNLSSNALLEQIAMRTGFFLYAVMVANLGTEAFASYQITAQILSLSYTFGDGIGVAATSLVGQNLGARRPDLSVLYTKLAQRLGYAVSGLLILLFCTFRYPIVGMFTDDSALIGMTVPMILLAAVAIPMQNAQPITSGCLRGAGDTRFVAWTMLISIMLVRPLSCALFLYCFGWGLPGAWLSFILDQHVRVPILIHRLSGDRWLTIKI